MQARYPGLIPKKLASAIIMALAACHGDRASPVVGTRTEALCAQHETGHRNLFTASSDVLSGPLQTCLTSRAEEAYVMVRGTGTRKFSTTYDSGKENGCKAPPPQNAPANVCPEIDVRYFLEAAVQKLRSRAGREGDAAFSWGRGKCNGPSLITYHWKYASDAATLLSDELRAWGIGESVALSVEETKCVVDLRAQLPDPQQCGDHHCNEDQECCNASCGVCVARGGYCFSVDCLRGTLK